MKWKLIFMIVPLFIMGISCTKKEPPPIWLNGNYKQVIFFSDKDKYEQEVNYYNAIIALKRDFPEEMKNIKTLSATDLNRYNHLFPINHCPALIIYDQNQVIHIMEGKKTTNDIVTSFSKILSES